MSDGKTSNMPYHEADKMQTLGSFSATISHKINNSLAYVLNYLFILKSTVTEKELINIIDKMEKGLIKTNTMTNELSDFSGILSEEPALLDLNELVTASVASYSSRIVRKGIKITADFNSQIDMRALGNGLSKTFINMLDNAVRAGAKKIEIAALGSGSDVLIEVLDDGSGIKKKDIPMVFDPFYTTRKSALGLGLYFSHQVVRYHGGNISCSSEKGKGAKFKINIPRYLG
jgi:signal transduction histidine kinase